MGMTTRGWSFIVPLVLFTLACSLAVWFVLRTTGHSMDQIIWGVISYYMLLTAVLHAWQERALEHDPGGFVRRYLAGLGIKMLLSFIVLVFLLLVLSKDATIPVVITFILLYLAFLGFSTVRMTSMLKKYGGR